MSESSSATYRHDVTGLVGTYPRRLGDNDPHLHEVSVGTKPLAYTPIPAEAVKQLRASRKSTNESVGDAPRDEKEEE